MAERLVTMAEIEAAQSEFGGWTKAQLATWGVPWPPPKGWKRRLVGDTPTNDVERSKN